VYLSVSLGSYKKQPSFSHTHIFYQLAFQWKHTVFSVGN